MEKKQILEAIKKVKANSAKRQFTQSFDLIVNLKDLNLKNPDDHVEFFVTTHNPIGVKRKICALVGPELADEAKKVCDRVIKQDELAKIDKKAAKKIAAFLF